MHTRQAASVLASYQEKWCFSQGAMYHFEELRQPIHELASLQIATCLC